MGVLDNLYEYARAASTAAWRLIYFVVVFLIFIGEQVRHILDLIVKYFLSVVNFFFDRLKRLITSSGLLVKWTKVSLFRGIFLLKKSSISLKKWYLRLRHIAVSVPLRHFANATSEFRSKITNKHVPENKTDSSRTNIRIGRRHALVTGFVLGVCVSVGALFLQQSYLFVKTLPNPALIGMVNFPVSTQILDRNDKLLFEVYNDENRTPVNRADIPSHVTEATIAIEDKDFYAHRGISVVGGIIRAVKETILTGQLQGGSTITQQLVKTSLLTPQRTITRKIKEGLLALWTERLYTKDEILQMYLNQVSYGGSTYGIEEAAQTYFGKSARELSLYEGAFLAGLPQAPTSYSPYLSPQLAESRRNEVLRRMLEDGYISQDEYEKGIATSILVKPPNHLIKAPHFVFYVRSLLESRYGRKKIEEGGLRVTTSLDLTLQEKAEEILKEELIKLAPLNVSNGAILVLDPKKGEILAMVGSRDYFEQPYGAYNVTTALRQPGSSIKPIMYSLALENGMTAAQIIDDTPVVFKIPGSADYKPVNYDGRFHGRVTLRQALANSYNIPAVKVLNQVGVGAFISHSQKMGINTWNQPQRYGLSLTLGGGEVTMIDMGEAFGVFANQGRRIDVNPLAKVVDYRGETLFTTPTNPPEEEVLSPEVAFIINDILADNSARAPAFGQNSNLQINGYRVSVKTGTTNDKRDNWTIGYTDDVVIVVWVGNNNNAPMHPYLTSGVTGAAPIFNRMMRFILEYDARISQNASLAKPIKVPEGVVRKKCFFSREEYFVKGTEKNVRCADTFLTSPTPSP